MVNAMGAKTFLAVALATLSWTGVSAAQAPTPGTLETYKDWTIGCDNRNRCEAVALLPEGGGPLRSSNDLRMEVRYEVEAIVSHRGAGAALQYEVRWAKWPDTTWEPAENLIGSTSVLRRYEEQLRAKGRWY